MGRATNFDTLRPSTQSLMLDRTKWSPISPFESQYSSPRRAETQRDGHGKASGGRDLFRMSLGLVDALYSAGNFESGERRSIERAEDVLSPALSVDLLNPPESYSSFGGNGETQQTRFPRHATDISPFRHDVWTQKLDRFRLRGNRALQGRLPCDSPIYKGISGKKGRLPERSDWWPPDSLSSRSSSSTASDIGRLPQSLGLLKPLVRSSGALSPRIPASPADIGGAIRAERTSARSPQPRPYGGDRLKRPWAVETYWDV